MKTKHLLLGAALFLAASSLRAAETPKFIDVKVSGHGQPVIFIPGLTTPGAIWDETVKHLQDRYECHVVTLAGFGSMPPVKSEHLLDDARDQIIAYAQAQKLNKPVIVGHSLGGSLALAIGEKAPELPGKIVCVDSLPFIAGVMIPGATTADAAQKSAEAMRQMMGNRTPEQFAAYVDKISIPSMVTKPEDVERIAALCDKSDPATAAQAMYELLTTDLRPDLGKIRCPILVMCALADKLPYATRPQLEQNYRSQYTNAPQTRFVFFEKARHFIMIDDPSGFSAELEKELAARQ